MDFREQIGLLVNLQTLEIEMRRIGETIGQVDRQTAELDSQLNGLLADVETAAARVQETGKRYRDLESELKINQGRIEKGHEKLRSVKTNKEYSMGLKEIEELKAISARIEDEMLACLDQIEQAKTQSKAAQAALDARQEEIRSEKAEILAGAEAARARLSEIQAESQRLAGRIPKPTLSFYRRVVAVKSDGVGVVEVLDSVCRGCNMNIPPQMYNELQRMDRLKSCPNCDRIIYWENRGNRSE
jgi:hypothetical protein